MVIDDEVRYFSARVSPMISAELKLLGVTVVARDVTEAVQARQRQQRLEELEKLTHAITTSFIQSDSPNGAINKTLSQIGEFMDVTRILVFMPRESSTIVDCAYEWRAPDVEPLIDRLQEVQISEKLPSLMPMLTRDGIILARHVSELPADMEKEFASHGVQSTLILPFLANDGKLGTITLEDNNMPRQWLPEEISTLRTIGEHLSRIIERERTQLALIQARDAALRSAQLKSEFMSNMSHEVRTPMTGLLGMLELLLETGLTSEQYEFADTAFTSAHNLLRILDDILDFSKIEAGRVLLEAKPIDPRSIVDEVKSTLAVQAAKKQILFESNIDAEVPEGVFCDPTRLRQILTNLASNAIKFTQEGSVTIRIRASGTIQDRARLRFEVQDTGIGISPDQKERIFESFVQADGTTTRKFGGTGLGLAISRQLIQLMGGEIDVTSEVGHGSTFGFTLTLPIATESPADSPFAQIAKLRILVVDDNAAARHVLVQQLRLWGASVFDLSNQNELVPMLLQKVEQNEPLDIVFMSGAKLAAAIRDTLKEKTPYLVRVNDGRGSSLTLENSFDAHFQYPYNPMYLYDLLLNAGVQKPQKSSPGTKPIRVLVADDNVINQRIVSKALHLENMTVDVAQDGEEALEFYAKNRYDLVLMDVHMPLLDGLEATRIIRAMGGTAGEVPVIALTASILQEEKERCLEAGMSAVLGKPFSIEQLRAEVHKWLAAKPTELRTS